MTADPRDSLSEITEIADHPVGRHIEAFFASVGWATVAGTLAFSFALFADSNWSLDLLKRGLLGGVLLTGVPVAFMVMGGMFLIGLPTSAILRLAGLERTSIYTILGAVGGGLMLGFFAAPWPESTMGSFLFPISGAIAGATAAFRWGRFRQEATEPHKQPTDGDPPSNPFHDMIH